LCIIGYIAGKFSGYTTLNNLIGKWKCSPKLTVHDSGWLIHNFTSEADKIVVLSRGPYSIFGRPLVLKFMLEYFDFVATDMSMVLVWVRFPNLPLQCWSPTCLSKIAGVLGKLLQCDLLITSMSMLSYARVLIEVDLLPALPTTINIVLPNGMPLLQLVVYELLLLPKFFMHCRLLGLTESICNKAGRNSKGKYTQSIPIYVRGSPDSSGLGPSAETAAMEHQHL